VSLLSNKSERSDLDSVAPMGYGATRTLERVSAAIGQLESAPIQFVAARDVPYGGLLLAVPALLAMGLLRDSAELYALPQGYYGLRSILLLLAMMALARVKCIEQLRYVAPGEWGNLLGLDRIPEVRTLRSKLAILNREKGRAARWNTELAKPWMGLAPEAEPMFYVDGHVRVYHGHGAQLPRHYVARQKLYLRATADYWINALDGQPFFYINQEIDHGLVQALRNEVVPWLETTYRAMPKTSVAWKPTRGCRGSRWCSTAKDIVRICLPNWTSDRSRCSAITAIRPRTGRWKSFKNRRWC
jgi:hypothetical protein